MAEVTDATRDAQTSLAWRRRGILAAAWAAVAGVVLRQTTLPVEAVAANVQYSLGDTNTFFTNQTATPVQINNQRPFAGGAVFRVAAFDSPAIDAIVGDGAAFGGGNGVTGIANATNAAGVLGQIPASGTNFAAAVHAVSSSSYTGPAPGTGGFGVLGVSTNGHGILGATQAAGGGGVVGFANGVARGRAGIFFGPVIVEGDFTVIGGAKSAAVPHPDGTHRRLYCVESPQSWFEDFGEGQLACGSADVLLDPDLAAVADLSDYHVFLTAYDADHLLHVDAQTPEGFRVQAKDPAASGRFSWRVVAKRKDIDAPRFETVEIPAAPRVPTIPEPAPVPGFRPRQG